LVGRVLGCGRRTAPGPRSGRRAAASSAAPDDGLDRGAGGDGTGVRRRGGPALRTRRDSRAGVDRALPLHRCGALPMMHRITSLIWLTAVWVMLWESWSWANLLGGFGVALVVMQLVPSHRAETRVGFRP